MKMTLLEVLHRHNVLTNLCGKKLPYKLAYAISKNVKKLEDELKIIDEGRTSLLEEYAIKDEEGKPVISDNKYELGENLEKYGEEYKKYMETDTEIETFTVPVSVLDSDDARFDTLTVEEIIHIDFMLEQ
jgi:hypothetical protein